MIDLTCHAGGIFTFVCRHGICYGFHVIERSEGRNDAFSVFRTRFLRPPRIIVYDFACQLMEYCLNRDPGQSYGILLLSRYG
jgi:hypothetical protein